MIAGIDVIEERLFSVAGEVARELSAKFESLRVAGSPEAFSDELGFTSRGQLAADGGPHPVAYIKYALLPKAHIRKLYPCLPHLADLAGKKAFELGVGPGYLFTLLRDLYGVKMVGIDVDIEKQVVFRELRQKLGIEQAVFEHRVLSGRNIPIPEGTEAVLSFWPVYDSRWRLDDHKWFLDHCSKRLCGRRLVAMHFNKGGNKHKPDVRDYYQANGVFPLGSETDFCLINL